MPIICPGLATGQQTHARGSWSQYWIRFPNPSAKYTTSTLPIKNQLTLICHRFVSSLGFLGIRLSNRFFLSKENTFHSKPKHMMKSFHISQLLGLWVYGFCIVKYFKYIQFTCSFALLSCVPLSEAVDPISSDSTGPPSPSWRAACVCRTACAAARGRN